MKRTVHVVALLLAALAFFAPRLAHAHKASDSYLTLTPHGETVDVRWDIALRDMDAALGLDESRDGHITWGELQAARAMLTEWAFAGLALSVDAGACKVLTGDAELGTTSHSDGAYATLLARASCPGDATRLGVKYTLLFDVDRLHRGVVRVKGGADDTIFVLQESAREHTFEGVAKASPLHFVREGTLHIWSGIDHLAFLFALLFPAVFRRQPDGKWAPVPRLRDAAVDVLRIVSAFTVAHSITLGLASFGYVSLPSRLVEATIAASVVVAAVNNLRPLFREQRWGVAFILGLVHGFGFSSALADLGASQGTLLATLVSFNVGVEVGQLSLVALFLPLAFLARNTQAYRRVVLQAGSAAVALVGAVWVVERAVGLKFLPF